MTINCTGRRCRRLYCRHMYRVCRTLRISSGMRFYVQLHAIEDGY